MFREAQMGCNNRCIAGTEYEEDLSGRERGELRRVRPIKCSSAAPSAE